MQTFFKKMGRNMDNVLQGFTIGNPCKMRRTVWCNMCNVRNYFCKNNRTTVLQFMSIWKNTSVAVEDSIFHAIDNKFCKDLLQRDKKKF